MDKDKLIAEWMDRFRAALSKCLIEEMKKVDLTRLLRIVAAGEEVSMDGKSAEVIQAESQPADTDLSMPRRRRQPKLCKEEGCERPARSRGLCGMHYQREQYAAKKKERVTSSKHVEMLTPPALVVAPAAIQEPENSAPAAVAKISGTFCPQLGCEREALKKGLCGKHFMAWVRANRRSTVSS